MRKVIAITFIALSSIFAHTASAQSLSLGVISGSSLPNISVGLVDFSVTSVQRTSPSQQNMLNNPIFGFVNAAGAQPLGTVDYWVTPTSTAPLTLLIASGGTISVTNTGETDQNVRIEGSFGVQSTVFGPYTPVPAGATVTLNLPSLGATFISGSQFFAPDPVFGSSFMFVLVTN